MTREATKDTGPERIPGRNRAAGGAPGEAVMDGQEVKTEKNSRNAGRVNCRVRNEKGRRLTSYLSWKHGADNGPAAHKAQGSGENAIYHRAAARDRAPTGISSRSFSSLNTFLYPPPSASVNRTFFSRFPLCNLHHYLFFPLVRLNFLAQRNSMNLPTERNQSPILSLSASDREWAGSLSHLAPQHSPSSVYVL